jgi:hypothetical protein
MGKKRWVAAVCAVWWCRLEVGLNEARAVANWVLEGTERRGRISCQCGRGVSTEIFVPTILLSFFLTTWLIVYRALSSAPGLGAAVNPIEGRVSVGRHRQGAPSFPNAPSEADSMAYM